MTSAPDTGAARDAVRAPVRTIFFGSGPVALPALEALHDSGLARIDAVVTAPPRPAGRKGRLTPTPVAQLGDRRGLSVRTPPTLRSEAALAELAATRPELIVLADYGRIIPPAVLELPRFGALNIHPSLLPRHRGAAPVAFAILEGDAVTGVTLMRMDAGLDTGPIVAQWVVPLDGSETAPELEARLAELGGRLLIESLPHWLDGTSAARPQPDDGVTLTHLLRREDGRLDPTLSAVELERRVRALQPWPGTFLVTPQQRLKVWSASVVPAPVGAPGSIVPSADALALVTADGALQLDEVQPAGGRRMSGAEYRRGHQP
jgi:methionyl-tRNA formyltransferase